MKSLLLKVRVLTVVLAAALLAGCATHKIDWASRLGTYTYDQAVTELGPPDKEAVLSDGSRVVEWLTRRGYTESYVMPGYYTYHRHFYGPVYPNVVQSTSPDYFLRLIFGPDNLLKGWEKFAK